VLGFPEGKEVYMLQEHQIKQYKQLLEEQDKLLNKAFKKNKINFIISVLLGAVIGTIIGVLLAMNDFELNEVIKMPYGFFLITILITMYLSLALHIILHEGGHLISGLLSGYRFQSYRVFSLVLYKKDGKFHLGKFNLRGTAGQCLLFPPEKKEDGSYPVILYNLGGGLANIIFSLLAIVSFIATESILLKTICVTFAIIGILIAITNLVPMNMGLQNDGMNLLSILRHSYNKEAFYMQVKVNGELSEGKRITEYPEEYFEIPGNADITNTLVVSVQILGYYRKLALFDMEGAREILASLEENCVPRKSNVFYFILAEKLFFMLLDKKPIEEIAVSYKYLINILRVGRSDVSLLRISYLYDVMLSEEEKDDINSLLSGKSKKREKIDKDKLYQTFVKTVKNHPVQGEAVIFSELVDNILTKREQSKLGNMEY
jgi:uncharacterized membrane protein YccF (DUF307 family)